MGHLTINRGSGRRVFCPRPLYALQKKSFFPTFCKLKYFEYLCTPKFKADNNKINANHSTTRAERAQEIDFQVEIPRFGFVPSTSRGMHSRLHHHPQEA